MSAKLWRLLAVGFVAGLVGCAGPQGPAPIGTGPVKVVATTSIIADTVRQVGGPHVEVTALMGPGVDPHTYSPSAGDSTAMESAHVVFFNGLHLEGNMAHQLEHATGPTRVVAVTRLLDPGTLRDGGDGAHDPHVWFDVKLWMRSVEVVRDELCSLDPPRAADYRANAERHLQELAKLDDEVREKANRIPKDRRILATSHDAFGYFARAYGFEVRGLQGVSTASAASTKNVEEMANFLGQRRVPAVFGETSVAPKGLQKVLDSVREKYKLDVRLVGGDDALYSDALGEPNSPGATYVGMVRHNIDTIARALVEK